MPATDERLIEVAKRAAPNAQIGCFFIPGIGTAEQLKSACAAGLDFVRVGYNATEIEDAYPFLELAKDLGLKVCLNFMKTLWCFARHVRREGAGRRRRRSRGGLLCRLRGQHVSRRRARLYERSARSVSRQTRLSWTQQSSVCRRQQCRSDSLRRNLHRHHALRIGTKRGQRSHRSRRCSLRSTSESKPESICST